MTNPAGGGGPELEVLKVVSPATVTSANLTLTGEAPVIASTGVTVFHSLGCVRRKRLHRHGERPIGPVPRAVGSRAGDGRGADREGCAGRGSARHCRARIEIVVGEDKETHSCARRRRRGGRDVARNRQNGRRGVGAGLQRLPVGDSVRRGVERELCLDASPGRHREDFEVPVAVALEREHGAVRRPCRRTVEGRVVGQLDGVASVRVHDPDVEDAVSATGRAAVRDAIAALFDQSPDLRFESRRVHFEDHFVSEYEVSGTAADSGDASFRAISVRERTSSFR